MARQTPFINLSLRIDPADMLKIDRIADAKNWPRAEVVRRMIEEGLETGRLSQILRDQQAEKDAVAAAEQAKVDEEAQALAAKRAGRAKSYASIRAWDNTGTLGFGVPKSLYPEAPQLDLWTWGDHMRGWTPAQVACLHKGIMPWESDWTAEPVRVSPNDGIRIKLGLPRRRGPSDPPEPTTIDGWVQLWKNVCAAMGRDPLV